MNRLVLSLFPGVGLLDRAFEQAGWCVVRGPDLLWGGDVCRFNPPSGCFAGVIGGSPCPDFSVGRNGLEPTGDGERLLREFGRVVLAADPNWWLLENVPGVPTLELDGYHGQRIPLESSQFGAPQRRRRDFQYGRHARTLGRTSPLIFDRCDGPANCDGPALAGTVTANDSRPFRECCRLQGLPDDYDLPGFTHKAKVRAVGNGVPFPMGLALATAIDASQSGPLDCDGPKRLCEVCGSRPVTTRARTCSDLCRQRKSRIERQQCRQAVTVRIE